MAGMGTPVTIDAARLRAALYAGLPAALTALLQDLVLTCRASGTPLFLVGGAVRDLVLGRTPLDLDLVLAGDAVALAAQVAARLGVPPTRHGPFGTATVPLPPALAPPPPAAPALDFVTARRERYLLAGELPQVEAADLAADLARRDFTINALALPLDPADPRLRDPHGGGADLAAGLIRALHVASFRDDPTRIFRAVRYEQRLGFALEPETLAWIEAALAAGMLDRLSPARVRQELERTLAEPDPLPALARLEALRVLAAVAAGWGWDPALAPVLACLPDAPLRLAALVVSCPPPVRARLTARLGLDARLLAGAVAILALAPDLPHDPPSRVAALLAPHSAHARVLARCLAAPAAAAVLARYESTWCLVRPLLTGDDLRALGLPPGPRYRPILAALRAARLDGQVVTRADELALVAQMLEDA